MGKQQVASFWAQRGSTSTKQRGEGVRLPTVLAGGEMMGLPHPPGCCHSAPRLGQLGSGGRGEKKETKLRQETSQIPHLIRIQPHPVWPGVPVTLPPSGLGPKPHALWIPSPLGSLQCPSRREGEIGASVSDPSTLTHTPCVFRKVGVPGHLPPSTALLASRGHDPRRL